MQIRFNNEYLETLYLGLPVRGKPRFNESLINQFKRTVGKLELLDNIPALYHIRSLNFEALKGNWKGYYSVRVNQQFRLILRVENNTILLQDILVIEDLSNHYE